MRPVKIGKSLGWRAHPLGKEPWEGASQYKQGVAVHRSSRSYSAIKDSLKRKKGRELNPNPLKRSYNFMGGGKGAGKGLPNKSWVAGL